ncbi:carboxylesterase [Xylaria flabelliformis]|nr:carboxylesterase [Xylaria flabelliformis]
MFSLIDAICISLLVRVGDSQVLTAALDYGTFRGAYNPIYDITYWQRIPFAAPPVDQNRFRAPQPPLPITHGVYDSSQTFDMCPQRAVNGSEDCLYLGLYGRPWTRDAPLRPVVVTFYGGGFIQGSASFTLPPSAYPILNVSDTSNMIFVYPNYRVNAFGFLPGKEVREDPFSDANAGLLDQAMALRWTRKYISYFGGDPDRITIWGQSAGGGSVLAQTIASHESIAKGRNRGRKAHEAPFRQALASSPFWPKTYRVDAPEAQWRYDTLANLTGCAGPESLKCLKSVDVQKIRDANLAIVDSHKYTTSTFEWGPVIDGVFLREPLSAATARRNGSVVAGYGMYNTHEGENFVPSGLKSASDTGTPPFNMSTASFDQWVSGYLPTLSRSQIDKLKEIYPEAGSAENIVAYDDTFTRAGLIYRDSTLACPAYWMAGSATDGGWIGEYTISPAQHASDVYWVSVIAASFAFCYQYPLLTRDDVKWNTINTAQQQDPLHYKGYAGLSCHPPHSTKMMELFTSRLLSLVLTGALASFFMTGDPNALKLTGTDVSGLPGLKTGQEWVIDSTGFTASKLIQLKERCAFWEEVAPEIPI